MWRMAIFVPMTLQLITLAAVWDIPKKLENVLNVHQAWVFLMENARKSKLLDALKKHYQEPAPIVLLDILYMVEDV